MKTIDFSKFLKLFKTDMWIDGGAYKILIHYFFEGYEYYKFWEGVKSDSELEVIVLELSDINEKADSLDAKKNDVPSYSLDLKSGEWVRSLAEGRINA